MYPKKFGKASKYCKILNPVLTSFGSIPEEITMLRAYWDVKMKDPKDLD